MGIYRAHVGLALYMDMGVCIWLEFLLCLAGWSAVESFPKGWHPQREDTRRVLDDHEQEQPSSSIQDSTKLLKATP